MNKKIILIVIAALLIYSTFMLRYNPFYRIQSPEASNGAIDLAGWNFSNSGAVSLDGEWECYDGQLLRPSDFSSAVKKKPKLTGFVKLTAGIPGNSFLFITQPKGVRTYRLIVRTQDTAQNYGIKVDNIKMSSLLYINGVLSGKSGVVASERQGYDGKSQFYTAYFRSLGARTEILLQTANYDYPFYPTQYVLLFGLQKDISSAASMTQSLEMGGLLIKLLLAFFYLCMHFVLKQGKSYLFGAFEFFGLALMSLTSGEELLYTIIPQIPTAMFLKIQQISPIIVLVSLFAYTVSVTQRLFSDLHLKALYALCTIYFVFVLLTQYRVNIYMILIRNVFALVVLLILIFRLYRLYRKTDDHFIRGEILLNFLCALILFISMGEIMLFNFGILATKSIGLIAACAFNLLIMLSIAYRFAINYSQILKMNRVKDEFITRASYAIKAPLTSVLNNTEATMKNNMVFLRDSETLQSFEYSRDIVNQVLRIADSTLDVTLLQNGQINFKFSPVDLAAIADIAAQSITNSVYGRKIAIQTDINNPLMAYADEDRVRQILLHLISNATNCMEDGTIRVYGEREGGMVSVYVADTGCGIHEELRKTIFEPYVSLNAQGVGLGLYISRLLARRMGGDLQLEWSEVQKGSRFKLTLPRCKANNFRKNHRKQIINGTVPSADVLYKGENHCQTVLVMDDELFNIQAVKYILEKQDYRIIAAFTSKQALDCLKSNDVDLVILDITMPANSGISVCKKIRQRFSLIELPVLLSGTSTENYDFELGMSAGANDFIAKPFVESELLSRVRTLTSLKRSMEDAVKNELAFLQTQIRPHFIYNTINTIVSFCYTDGEQAAKLLTDFSKYLRMTFEVDERAYVPLRHELELIRAYSQIERARFGDSVCVEYSIDEDLLERNIPVLIIQPLVENAIKHGLRKKENGGIVTVCAQDVKGIFTITVKDTGAGMPPEQAEAMNNGNKAVCGVGYLNVRRRVNRWKNAHMEIHSTESVGTTVTISVNYEEKVK